MRTLLFGQVSSPATSNNTIAPPMGSQINNSDGGFLILAPASRYDLYCPIAGVLQNFRIKTSVATSAGLDFAVYNITQNTSVTLSIASGQTTQSDDSTQLAVNVGDFIRVTWNYGGTNTGTFAWSFQLVGNNAFETFICGNLFGNTVGTNGYISPVCLSTLSSTESKRRFYCTTSGTIRSFYIHISNAGTISGGLVNSTASIFKNGVEEASSIVNYSGAFGGTTNLNVTGLSIPFVPGDSLSVKIIDGSGGYNLTWNTTIMYNPVTDGEQMIGGLQEISSSNTPGVVQYGYINGASPFAGNGNFESTSEEKRQMYLAGFSTISLKNFRVNVESAPGASETREYRIRKNGSNGNGVVDISNSSTSGVDNTNIDTIQSGDLLDITHEVL